METTITANMIGMNDSEHKAVSKFLATGQIKSAYNSCVTWVRVGEIIARIKVAKRDHKIGGKLGELVDEFFGATISNDERANAVKLAENKAKVMAWFTKNQCNKHHPRSIWSEYSKKPASTKTGLERLLAQAKAVAKTYEKEWAEMNDEDKAQALADPVVSAYVELLNAVDQAA